MSKRGGFKRDGSTHYSGISREQQLIQILSNPESAIRGEIGRRIGSGSSDSELNPAVSGLEFRHVGGTGTKIDAEAYCATTGSCLYTLSVKNHQSKSGTFDWTNTSKGFPGLEACMESLKQIKLDFLQTEESLRNVDQVRTRVNGIFSDILDRIGADSEFLRSILASIYEGNPDGMVVFLAAKDQVVYFPKSELSVLRDASASDTKYMYYLKHKPGTASAQIMYRQSVDLSVGPGSEYNTQIRIRLVLNNGVGAFLGLSPKNKYSVPCIKIQQDGVDALLDGITNKYMEETSALK